MPSPEVVAASITSRFAGQLPEALVPQLQDEIALQIRRTRETALRMDVPARLAQAVLDLLLENEAYSPERAPQVALRVHQEKVSEAIGASRSYVNQLLKEWQRLRILRSVGRSIYVEKPARLLAIAEGRE